MDEPNATLSTVDPGKATDIAHKVSQFYEGMDLATAIVSLHILLKAYLDDAPEIMVIESQILIAKIFVDLRIRKAIKKGKEQ